MHSFDLTGILLITVLLQLLKTHNKERKEGPHEHWINQKQKHVSIHLFNEKTSDLLADDVFALSQILHVCGEKLCLKAIFQDFRACLWKCEGLIVIHLKLQDNKKLLSARGV